MDLWWLVKCKFHGFCPSPQIWQKVVAWRKQWTWSLGSSLLSQLCSLSHTSFLPLSMLLSLWRNGGGWFDLPTSQGIKAKWVMHTWKGLSSTIYTTARYLQHWGRQPDFLETVSIFLFLQDYITESLLTLNVSYMLLTLLGFLMFVISLVFLSKKGLGPSV